MCNLMKWRVRESDWPTPGRKSGEVPRECQSLSFSDSGPHTPTTWYCSCLLPCPSSQLSVPVTLKSLPRESLLLHLQDSRATGFLRRKPGRPAVGPRQRCLPQGDEDKGTHLRRSCRPWTPGPSWSPPGSPLEPQSQSHSIARGQHFEGKSGKAFRKSWHFKWRKSHLGLHGFSGQGEYCEFEWYRKI